MKYLYKYPQAAFPYVDLVETSRRRGRHEMEYELLDTGVFDQDRYFDVFVEYAKAVSGRHPDPDHRSQSRPGTGRACTSCRRSGSGTSGPGMPVPTGRPSFRPTAPQGRASSKAVDPNLGERYLYCEGDVPLLFTENETNTQRIFGVPNRTPYVKDSINDYVVNGQAAAVNPEKKGTKVAAHYRLTVNPGQSQVVRLRLSRPCTGRPCRATAMAHGPFGSHFDDVLQARRKEADEFYATVIPRSLHADAANVMRQALAGMLWSKQFYHYDVDKWLEERGSDPFKATRKAAPRNDQWHHMYNGDIISMPDKWEYPWYAAWDLAFHVLALTMVDVDFGKQQLQLMLRERYLHPNGQIPAYEWNFGDVNPPVHAWSTIFTYRLEKAQKGEGDTKWLKSCFQKLLLNFTWWVNRKDRSGRNVFEGGFLGLDNIGVFDRSAPLPTGGYLEQADGTAWMALFADNMLEIAIELAMTDEDYADMVLKFLEHDTWITSSLVHLGGGTGMWDEEDGFFYDVLRLPDGQAQRLKVRSMVGLLPLCAATVFEPELFAKYPEIAERFQWFLDARPELCAAFHDPRKVGVAGRRLFSVLDEGKLRRVLAKMLDENEFLSPYGIRSLSRYHADHPYVLPCRRAGVPRWIPAGGIGYRHVRRQLELARADLDAGQQPDHPRPVELLRLLWR